MSNQFDQPVAVAFGGQNEDVRTLARAIEILSDARWPERGPRHRDALEICLKARDGHRSVGEARSALLLAAKEAGNVAAR
jgi:hypothetical protein